MAFYLLFPFVGVVIVVCSIPADCWRRVRQNCRRQDGSFSDDRATRELKLFSDHVPTLTTLSLLAVLGCFALDTFVASVGFITGLLVLIRIVGHGTAKFARGIRMRRRGYARRDVDSMRWAPAPVSKELPTED